MDNGLEKNLSAKVYGFHSHCLTIIAFMPLITEIPVTCEELINPQNGAVDFTGVNVGSTATYSCFFGFELKGDKHRTCQSNGQWSGREPFCKSTYV